MEDRVHLSTVTRAQLIFSVVWSLSWYLILCTVQTESFYFLVNMSLLI